MNNYPFEDLQKNHSSITNKNQNYELNGTQDKGGKIPAFTFSVSSIYS